MYGEKVLQSQLDVEKDTSFISLFHHSVDTQMPNPARKSISPKKKLTFDLANKIYCMEKSVLQACLLRTIQVATQAGDYIRAEFGRVSEGQIEEKDLNSLVSYVDKTAEKICVSGLREIVPEAGFLTEEDTIDDITKNYIWVIDPLDGTTNFLMGVPFFAVSIGLKYKGELILGAVIDVMHKDVYAAGKGLGTTKNGLLLDLQKTSLRLENALIATGFPYNNLNISYKLAVMKIMMEGSRGIRRLGSAALDMCLVASGVFGAYYEWHLNEWDVSAGIIIVQEAGGKVSAIDGISDYQDGNQIMASHADIHSQILDLLNQTEK